MASDLKSYSPEEFFGFSLSILEILRSSYDLICVSILFLYSFRMFYYFDFDVFEVVNDLDFYVLEVLHDFDLAAGVLEKLYDGYIFHYRQVLL